MARPHRRSETSEYAEKVRPGGGQDLKTALARVMGRHNHPSRGAGATIGTKIEPASPSNRGLSPLPGGGAGGCFGRLALVA